MFKKQTQMRCCIQTENGSFAKGVNNSAASKQDNSVIAKNK